MLRRAVTRDHRLANQTENRRNDDDVPGSPCAHCRQYCFGDGNLAEEVRVHLQPQFIECDVFGESAHGKSGVVYEHVNASMIARDLLDGCRNAVKISDVELSYFHLRGQIAAKRL